MVPDSIPTPPYVAGPCVPDLSVETRRLIAMLERMAQDTTEALGAGVVASAKEEFLLSTGRVHEDDPIFEERMAQFTEWFLLDRPLGENRAETPCVRWLILTRQRLSPREIADVRALGASHRALLSFAGRTRSGDLICDDLLSGIRWRVAATDPPAGLSLGNLFEARLVCLDSGVHFTGAFCYHPPELSAPLRRRLTNLAMRAAPRTQVLETLMAWRLAYDRAEGMPATRIYRLDDL